MTQVGRVLGWPLVALMVMALVFGGGGIRHGLTNLLVQLTALGVILFQPGLVRQFAAQSPRWLQALLLVTLLVPLIQLVPLPPGLWQALPGREMALETRSMIGAESSWFPITLDRARTAIALFALLAPLAAILCLGGLTPAKARQLLVLIVALTFLQYLFGVIQFASGGESLKFYETNETGRFYGFFVGHIASGLFMVIGFCALVGCYASKKRTTIDNLLYPAAAVLLCIGVILTGSRSAVVLLVLPGLWAAWVGWTELRRYSPRLRYGVLGAAALSLIAVGAVVATNQRLGDTWDRFSSFEDSRPDIWADTEVAAERYWPVGSGMGTFDEVFQVEESLETLTAKRAARAHNDYLEIALEAGIGGLVLVAAWFAALLYAAYRGLRSSYAPFTIAASLALLCIALQSLLYFPLRNMTVLCVAGSLVALLTAPLTIKRDPGH